MTSTDGTTPLLSEPKRIRVSRNGHVAIEYESLPDYGTTVRWIAVSLTADGKHSNLAVLTAEDVEDWREWMPECDCG